MNVSRETFIGFSKLLELIDLRLKSSFGGLEKNSSFEGVSKGLLPFLILLYSQKNKKPLVVICDDYSMKMSFFESIGNFLGKKCFNFTDDTLCSI